MFRRISASGLALLILLPGPAARADEGDLSFMALISGGVMLLSGSALCFVEPSDPPGPFATRSFYGGIGTTFALENFQSKSGGSPFDPRSVTELGKGPGLAGRRFIGRNEDAGQLTDRDENDPRVPEDPPGTPKQDLPEPTGERSVTLDGKSNGKPILIYGPANGIVGETRPDAEDGWLPPASADGGSFGSDAVLSVKVDDGAAWGINGRLGFRCHPRAALEASFEWLGEDFDLSFDTAGLERSDPLNPLNGKTEMHWRHVTVESNIWTAGANARFFLMTGRVQPYVLGGIGLMKLDETARRYDVAKTSPTATERCPQDLAFPVLSATPGGDASTDPNGLLPSRNCSYTASSLHDSAPFDDVDLAARLGGGVEFYLTDRLSLNVEGVYVRPSGQVENYDYVSFSAGVLFRFGGGLFRDSADN